MAEHDDVIPPGPIVAGHERSAQEGSATENVEVGGGHTKRLQLDGSADVAQGDRATATRGGRNVFEDCALVRVVEIVARSDGVALAGGPCLPDPHNATGVWIRERCQQHGVDHAEDGRVRADPQRESQQADSCHARPLAKHAHGVADVVDECVHVIPARNEAVYSQPLRSESKDAINTSLDDRRACSARRKPGTWCRRAISMS